LSEQSYRDQKDKQKSELQATQKELNRYQSAWKDVQSQLTQVQENGNSFRRRFEDLRERMEASKKQIEFLQESLKKEKRDKQIALSCLHTAETKLEQLNQLIEEMKLRQPERFSAQGLELKF
jgi:chromosome segregation ATPase